MSARQNKVLPKGIRMKNGSYEARASVKGVNICLHSTDLDKLIKQFEEAKEKAKKSIEYRRKTLTLDEWFEEWFVKVKMSKVKETSVPTMRRNYTNTFGFYLGSKKINDISASDIQEVVNAMKKCGKATSTIRDALGRMRECFDFAIADRLLTYNPCLVIDVPWENKVYEQEEPFTQEEQNIFLNELEIEHNWYKELFYIMFLTGMRVGEIGALHWSDIDFNRKHIRVRGSLSCSYNDGIKSEMIVSPKTCNSVRVIPFMGEAEDMLISQKKKMEHLKSRLGKRWRCEDKDIVFSTTMGSYCSRYIVQKEINKVIGRINEKRAVETILSGKEVEHFKHSHPHMFRHTFATRCFEYGMEPKVVQMLMGHSSITTTMNIYVHVMKEKQMSETLKFGNANKFLDEQEIPKVEVNIPKFISDDKRMIS